MGWLEVFLCSSSASDSETVHSRTRCLDPKEFGQKHMRDQDLSHGVRRVVRNGITFTPLAEMIDDSQYKHGASGRTRMGSSDIDEHAFPRFSSLQCLHFSLFSQSASVIFSTFLAFFRFAAKSDDHEGQNARAWTAAAVFLNPRWPQVTPEWTTRRNSSRKAFGKTTCQRIAWVVASSNLRHSKPSRTSNLLQKLQRCLRSLEYVEMSSYLGF